MLLTDYIIDTTKAAVEEAFRYAAAVPEEKLEWTPSEGGRTVLDMCRELGKCPDWAYQILSTDKMPDWSEEHHEEQMKEMSQWKTVADCHAACVEKLERLFEVYRSMTEERLKETKWLPYNGGRDHTYLEMLDYPRWNSNYHLGQIAYIQILYGDKKMY